jgi:hypothetical protein
LPAPAAPEPREEPGSDAAAVAAQAALDAERKAPLSIEQAVMYFDFSAENFDAVRATLQRRDVQLSPSRAARGSLAESTPAPADPPTEPARVGGSELVISIPRDKLTATVEQLAVQPGLIRKVDLPAANAAAAAGQTSRANDLAARAVERVQSGAVPPATVRLYVVVEPSAYDGSPKPSAEANPVLPAGDEQGEGNK